MNKMLRLHTHSSGGSEWYCSSSSELPSVVVDSIFNTGFTVSIGINGTAAAAAKLSQALPKLIIGMFEEETIVNWLNNKFHQINYKQKYKSVDQSTVVAFLSYTSPTTQLDNFQFWFSFFFFFSQQKAMRHKRKLTIAAFKTNTMWMHKHDHTETKHTKNRERERWRRCRRGQTEGEREMEREGEREKSLTFSDCWNSIKNVFVYARSHVYICAADSNTETNARTRAHTYWVGRYTRILERVHDARVTKTVQAWDRARKVVNKE